MGTSFSFPFCRPRLGSEFQEHTVTGVIRLVILRLHWLVSMGLSTRTPPLSSMQG